MNLAIDADQTALPACRFIGGADGADAGRVARFRSFGGAQVALALVGHPGYGLCAGLKTCGPGCNAGAASRRMKSVLIDL